jgi:murein DD-endopeptidase MepM/ murein hydrolase activator NlpD
MRGSKTIFVLVLVSSACHAAVTGAFRSISWTPTNITTGAPCLFRVEMSLAATTLSATWQGHELTLAPSATRNVWYGLAGVDVEGRPGSYVLELRATLPDGAVVRLNKTVLVTRARYRTETLRVAERYVEPDAETQVRIEADKELKHAAFAHEEPVAEWSGTFVPPVDTGVTEGFGTRRTFNRKLASIHRGLDYHAAPGTPVVAANSGVVVLARELFYEGNCVILDHGLGFTTIYMHLSQLEVSEGQRVQKGQELGLSGATGRATGPHLHVAARWEGAYLDPAQLWTLQLPDLHAVSVSTVKAAH